MGQRAQEYAGVCDWACQRHRLQPARPPSEAAYFGRGGCVAWKWSMTIEVPGVTDLVPIGAGASSVVYRGIQTAFARPVAVKVFGGSVFGNTMERFRRECRAIGRVAAHPNIVAVFEAGGLPTGQPYIVMQLAESSLADRIERTGPLPVTDAVDMAACIADGLQAAHDTGLLHRDVKPGNVLLDRPGTPMLADFGIAWLADGENTTEGPMPASVGYVPPETLDGARPTVQSDVYSLAATLYCMLFGHGPFTADPASSVSTVARRVLEGDLDGSALAELPPALEHALRIGLARDLALRPKSAADFATLLRSCLDATDGTVASRPLASRRPNRRRVAVAAGVAALVATGAGVMGLSTGTSGPRQVPRPSGLIAPTTAANTLRKNCSAAYPTVCIPDPLPDLDCRDLSVRNFKVLPPDPHHLDRDHDGLGCVSN